MISFEEIEGRRQRHAVGHSFLYSVLFGYFYMYSL